MGKSLFVFVKKNSLFARLSTVVITVILSCSWLLPLMTGTASAAGQLTSRSVSISSAIPSATGVSYTFDFTLPAASTSQIQGIKFTACTTATATYPGGTCTAPTGMSGGGNGFTGASFTNQSGFQGATNFAVDGTGANDCTASANVLCVKRTDTTSQTGGTAKTIKFGGIKNPSSVNTAFYIGITTYTTVNWTGGSIVDAGTTATATVQSLTVSARVAEILNFCVGSTAIDDATTTTGADCSAISGTSVNIGTLDSSSVNISPVTINGGDSNNGVAMLRTNAANGSTVSYRAIQAGTGTNHLGTLRITGASCNAGTVNSDGCINAAGGTQTPFTAGTEDFGLTVGGVNCGSTSVVSYTCDYSTGTTNLAPDAQYIGDTYTQGTTGIFGASAAKGFAWDESGNPAVIASSASSPIKQVDDEALILKFAAASNIITPFGSYSVQADFIAVPTF